MQTTTNTNLECPRCAADLGPSPEFFWHDPQSPCWPLRDPMGPTWAPDLGMYRTDRPQSLPQQPTRRRVSRSRSRVDDLNIHSYADADRELGSRRTRRVANNTWLIRGDACIMVRLHATHIVTYWTDGRIEFNTGGYHTRLTRGRMARFAPRGCTVWSGRYGYVLIDGTEEIPFEGDTYGIQTLIISARRA